MLLKLLAAVTLLAPLSKPWMTLPPTPTLPKAQTTGYVSVNGVRIWYAMFGSGSPVVLLHGGLANANWLGLQVRALAPHYRVIVFDSRCHGRSTCNSRPLGYDLMASDVLGALDALHIRRVALFGWSDGAIIGLDIAIHHPERLTRLFAFAANSDPSGVKDISRSPVFTQAIARFRKEYAVLSPTKQWQVFYASVTRMWATQPHFSASQLRGIHVLTWIVDADHDEAIKRENTDSMAAEIPGAGELILPRVSHFAFIQDPKMFNTVLLRFLSVRR